MNSSRRFVIRSVVFFAGCLSLIPLARAQEQTWNVGVHGAWVISTPCGAGADNDSPLDRLNPAKIDVEKWPDLPKEVVAIFTPARGTLVGAAASPDGKWLAAGGPDGDGHVVRLWDVAAGTEVAALPHKDHTGLIAFSPDSKTLATASQDGVIRLWSVAGKDTKIAAVLEARKDVPYSSLAYAPDGKTLAGGLRNGDVRLWDLAGLKPRERVVLKDDFSLRTWALAFSADGKTLATGGNDAQVRVWDLSKEEPRLVHKIVWQERDPNNPNPGVKDSGGYPYWGPPSVTSVALSPDGKTLLAGGSQDSPTGTLSALAARRWDVSGKKTVKELTALETASDTVLITPDGKTLVTWSFSGRIAFWEASGEKLRERTFPAAEKSWLGGRNQRMAAMVGDGRHVLVVFEKAIFILRLP